MMVLFGDLILIIVVTQVFIGAGNGGNKNTFNVDDVGYATAAAAGLG